MLGLLGDVLGIGTIFALGGAAILACAFAMRMTPSIMNVEKHTEAKASPDGRAGTRLQSIKE
jgi:hypothetical protein